MERLDRLARFGVEHLGAALAVRGRRVVVIDGGETTDDLVCDMIVVLTGVCGRRCGRRAARDRAVSAARHQRRLVEVTGSR